jgi:hypothetical protein
VNIRRRPTADVETVISTCIYMAAHTGKYLVARTIHSTLSYPTHQYAHIEAVRQPARDARVSYTPGFLYESENNVRVGL